MPSLTSDGWQMISIAAPSKSSVKMIGFFPHPYMVVFGEKGMI